MYKYETHSHTYPVSRCAKASVRETLEFYKELGYDGVFITNHFLDGNVNIDFDSPMTYEERVHFYFSDYEEGLKIGEELGIKVFCGVEMSYLGTDFLVYGLDKNWYLQHPEIMGMEKSKELPYLTQHGALVVHAHPYREDSYIDHIRLYPRQVEGIEIINAGRRPLENAMAKIYAEQYDLLQTAGSDNHLGKRQKKLAGMYSASPIQNEAEFIAKVRAKELECFETLL